MHVQWLWEAGVWFCSENRTLWIRTGMQNATCSQPCPRSNHGFSWCLASCMTVSMEVSMEVSMDDTGHSFLFGMAAEVWCVR